MSISWLRRAAVIDVDRDDGIRRPARRAVLLNILEGGAVTPMEMTHLVCIWS